jgi:hypothetical protein
MVVMAATTATHRQHSAATAAVAPPGVSPEGMLETVCAPPQPSGPGRFTIDCGTGCHDVNQLIVTTINTPLHCEQRANHSSGTPEPSTVHSRTPMIARTPSAVSTPMVPRAPMTSCTTADLRAELEHRRSGEDGRITIERHRERHHNLNCDFGTTNTTSVG